jgi:hypothetical protein
MTDFSHGALDMGHPTNSIISALLSMCLKNTVFLVSPIFFGKNQFFPFPWVF